MAIEVTDLTTLDPALVASQQLIIAQQLQEANPTLDLKRGVLHDLLAYYSAILATKTQVELQRYLSARSLMDILNDPTLADPDQVDAIFSNYRVTRGAGASAVGQLTVILSGPVSVTIGSGAVFTANGIMVTANSAFTAKTEASQINSSTDRLLQQLADGTWAFNIDVTATTVGTVGMLKKNTLAVPTVTPNNYVTSYVASDFSAGVDQESNSAMVARLQQGIAAQAPSNRVNIQAMLRAQAAFARVLTTSIIGYGDPELIRAEHSIFPVKFGGYVDWYIRTQERAVQLTLSKQATLLSRRSSDNAGIWQISIGRNDAPGFYEVRTIAVQTSGNTQGSLPILSDVRGNDFTGLGFVPDVLTVEEGAYSRYQTSVIQFADPATDPHAAIGATGNYQVTVIYLPLIDQIQDFMSNRDHRSISADLLVKAPIPVFVQLTLTIYKAYTQANPNIANIQTALASTVNNADFTGTLYASQLQDIVYGYLTSGMRTGGIEMLGRLRYPDGTTMYVTGDDVLTVPDVPEKMVTASTCQFFLDPTDVAVTITTNALVSV